MGLGDLNKLASYRCESVRIGGFNFFSYLLFSVPPCLIHRVDSEKTIQARATTRLIAI